MTTLQILLRCPFGGFTPVHPDDAKVERHPAITTHAWVTFDCTWCAQHAHPRGHTVQVEAHIAGDLETAGVRAVGLLSQTAKDAAALMLDRLTTAFSAPLRHLDDAAVFDALTTPTH